MANVCRGMVAGMLAGCAASWLMTNLGSAGKAQAKPKQQRRTNEAGGQRPPQSRSRQAAHNGGVGVEEPAAATAQVVSRKLFEHELSSDETRIAGPAVHYAYGSLVGALYGGVAELIPGVGAGLGLPFGAALWLLGDEIAVPALGLGKCPTEIAPEQHADALASHFIYGATTDLLRRVLRHVV
jgi:putative membrane protein